MHRTVHVPLAERGYDIMIGRGLLPMAATLIRGLSPTRVVLVCDSNTAPLAGAWAEALDARVVVIPAGEASKSPESLARLHNELLRPRDLDRASVILAFGGGMIGDLAGFAAATLYRGVRFVQVPTSLLAMVDSSVGGKTAVNHATGKNLIGAFHQPVGVFCDLDLLKTLPRREYVSALAEVVKTAAIGPEDLLSLCEQRADDILAGGDTLEEIIARCVAFKAEVVSRDERETTGERATLNLGHTLAHVIETARPGEYLHGEAVAIGLAAALRVSVALAGLAPSEAERVTGLLTRFGLPVTPPAGLDAAEVRTLLTGDKKRAGDTIGFIVLRRPGLAEALRLRPDELAARLLDGANRE